MIANLEKNQNKHEAHTYSLTRDKQSAPREMPANLHHLAYFILSDNCIQNIAYISYPRLGNKQGQGANLPLLRSKYPWFSHKIVHKSIDQVQKSLKKIANVPVFVT